MGGATTPPHKHTHFTPSLPFIRPYSPHNHTGVVYLINCHGLTFDLLPRPPRHPAGVRGHNGRGTRPPIITSRLWVRIASYPGLPMFFNVSREKSGRPGYEARSRTHKMQARHGPAMPRPTGGNKTCIKAHTHTLHTGLGTCPHNFFFFFFQATVQTKQKKIVRKTPHGVGTCRVLFT